MGKKSDSHINRTDNCSTGNKEAGLVNSWEYSRIPQSVMKTQTNTNLYFSINGVPKLSCCYPIYPKITSVSPKIIRTVPTQVTVYGSNFIPGAEVKLENSNGDVNSGYKIVSFKNKRIVIDITTIITDPFNIKVKNPSGLSFTYPDALEFKTYFFSLEPDNDGPVTLAPVTEQDSVDIDLSISKGSESDVSIVYEILGEALPSALNFDTSSGKITGTVGDVTDSSKTYNFSVKYTITDNSVSEEKLRAYILTVNTSTISADVPGI